MMRQPSTRGRLLRQAIAISCAACLFAGAIPSLADAQSSASGTVIYSQSLKGSGTLSTQDTKYCHLAYQDTGYVVANITTENVCDAEVTPVGILQPHVRIEVTVALQKGTTDSVFGVYFGEQPGETRPHFHLNLNAQGQFSVEFITGDARANPFPWTNDAAIQKGLGALNKLDVEVSGPRASFYVNGKLVGSILAPAPIQGKMGFGMTGFGAEAVFSNFTVTNLPATN
ncbi:MAG TPA: hypothetical protein VLV89_08040 [Candidatus Acidoferrum sp.]|nr:hypothetical protein [Candidatus Acidoferrum sp.]